MSSNVLEIITSLIDNIEPSVYNKQCICSHQLQQRQIGINGVIEGSILCDCCYKDVENNALFWHCSEKFNIVHPNGYDICNECYLNGAETAENELLIILNEANDCEQGTNCQ